MRRYVVALLVVVCAAVSGHAEQKKTPWPAHLRVFVTHNGNDGLGKRYAYELREQLRASNGYPISDTEEGSNLTLRVVTLDERCMDVSEVRSAVSVIIVTRDHTFGQGWLFFVTDSLVSELAHRTVADLDEYMAVLKAKP